MQARLLSGRYRTDYLLSKWTSGSGACSLPGCLADRGDTLHLFSGQCTALRGFLSQTLSHALNALSPFPPLHEAAKNALNSDQEYWVKFILDPSTDPLVIQYAQEEGTKATWPIFKFSRSFIWCMHKQRKRLKENYPL